MPLLLVLTQHPTFALHLVDALQPLEDFPLILPALVLAQSDCTVTVQERIVRLIHGLLGKELEGGVAGDWSCLVFAPLVGSRRQGWLVSWYSETLIMSMRMTSGSQAGCDELR